MHAQARKENFVVDGFGLKHYPVMYNDIGADPPEEQSAGIKGMEDVAEAF